jgi:hypothetical protein
MGKTKTPLPFGKSRVPVLIAYALPFCLKVEAIKKIVDMIVAKLN